jgi:hypothetical protein
VLHGFPDSPYSYRYLLPALTDAGYRAVAPFNRGLAPTELPDDRHHVHASTMVANQIELREALGGDDQAILNIPPFAIFGENIVTYDQIKRSFYFWYFQMQRVCEHVISADNFAFTDRARRQLWRGAAAGTARSRGVYRAGLAWPSGGCLGGIAADGGREVDGCLPAVARTRPAAAGPRRRV